MKKIILIIMIVSINLLHSKEHFNEDDIKSKLPQIASANNSGRDFWFSIPPCYEESQVNNLIRMFCISSTSNTITCENKSIGYSSTKAVKANEITVFDLKPSEAQPFLQKLNDPTPIAKIYSSKGIHIFSEQAFVCYVFVSIKYTTDGFLAIPTNGLGKEYIAGPYTSSYWPGLVAWTLVTAAYDNTNVKYTMGGDGASTVETETKILDQPGKFVNITMQKGDVWCVGAMQSTMDIAGSKIVADKPVAVTSGVACANIPLSVQGCGYNAEMETPTETWGKSILIPTFQLRQKPGIIRIFAKYPNTKVYREGNLLTTLKNSKGVKDEGWIEERASPLSDPKSPYPVIYTADKPISIIYYNTGSLDDTLKSLSDPYQMIILPVEQFQTNIIFGNINLPGALKIANNYASVVYELDSLGGIPNDIEFGTWNKTKWDFVKLSTKTGVEKKFGNIPIDNKFYGVKNIPLPFDSSYTVFRIKSSTSKFTSYSFGYDSTASYGFPTSSAFTNFDKTDYEAPIVTYKLNCNGSTSNGLVIDKPDNTTVRSNLFEAYLLSDSSYNYTFKIDAINQGTTIQANWSLLPIDKQKEAKAFLVFKDMAGNDTTIKVEYYSTNIKIDSLGSFGNFKKDTPPITNDIVFKNNSKKELLVNKISFKKGNQGFTLEPLSWDKTVPIPIGASRVLSVKFTPDSNLIVNNINNIEDSLGIGDECNFTYLVATKALLKKTLIDLMPPLVTYTKECNGKFSNGVIIDKAIDTMLRSNLKEVVMDSTQGKSFNFKLNVGNITQGVTVQTTFSLVPIDTLKDAKATIIFRDVAGNDTTIVFNNYVTNFTFSKDLDFGKFKSSDEASTKKIYVTNKSNKYVFVKDLKLQKSNIGFSIEPLNWDISKAFANSDSQVILITFNPIEASKNSSLKLFVDSLGIGDDCWFNNKIKVFASIDSTSGIEFSESDLFSIDAIIPNPITNEGGVIKYSIGKEAKVEINIINSIGNKIEILSNQNTQIGKYSLDIPINKLSNGTYFVELKAENHILNKKFVIIK